MNNNRREEIRQEAEWRRCKGKSPTDLQACLFFLRKYWFIKHPERGKIIFDPREAQVETLGKWLTERYTITLKARQIGFSTLAAAVSFWLCFFWPDKFLILLSRTERESIKLLQKAKYGQRWLPAWMKVRGPKETTDHQQKMAFDNDSAVESLPSANDPARGESVYMIFVDEWAFLPNPEEAWASIEPVADVGGRVHGLSTANGTGNFFYEMVQKARSKHSRFSFIFYPWSANADRGEDWYESKAEDMPEWQLHQEYPRDPDEAFIKSGNPVFDVDILPVPYEPEGTYAFHVLTGPRHWELRDASGPVRVWEKPKDFEKYTIGADTAEGLGYGDYSAAHVINVRSGLLAATWHGHIDPDEFGEELVRLGAWYNSALVGVEVNNHGLMTVRTMDGLKYTNLYFREALDTSTRKMTRRLGWRTQSNTKPLIIDGLVRDLRSGGLICPDELTLGELRTYVRDVDGKMHGSPHDDRVMSYAIANHMRTHAFAPEYVEKTNDYGTFDWWAKTLDEERGRTRGPLVIGQQRRQRDLVRVGRRR